jgi:hypothetical protein
MREEIGAIVHGGPVAVGAQWRRGARDAHFRLHALARRALIEGAIGSLCARRRTTHQALFNARWTCLSKHRGTMGMQPLRASRSKKNFALDQELSLNFFFKPITS